MKLMIPIEEAKKILRRYDHLLDDHVGEILINAMEQESIVIDQGEEGWEGVIRQRVEEVTEPNRILAHAKDGTLNWWISSCQNEIMNEMHLALDYKRRTQITETDKQQEPLLDDGELSSVREMMVSVYECMIRHLNENELGKCMDFIALQLKRMSTAVT